ncbi:Dam family site-specific DNA-(adenine-N6)-methyltransferase [Candidatus Bathyarchaeota archaeon]|nr:Dam family site-specific DNA-(adenine-N6)-methyltransferase [Candidatus Bathyarchaeota archaeon]
MQSETVESSAPSPSPFLKWAGGKGSLLHSLLPLVPERMSNYYEPFLGGGSLFFAICSRKVAFHAHLSDLNNELINAYTVIRDRTEELIGFLSKLQYEYDHSASQSRYYYSIRDRHPSNSVQSAARLIFLNKTCYNGLYRVNSQGEFNVPFGRYLKPKILNVENIRAVGKALRDTSADLLSIDYKTSLASCGKNDLVYLDPPYQPLSKTSSFTDYTPAGFSEHDQRELAEQFNNLVDRGCIVLLSNSATPLTVSLYSDFETRNVTVNRPINSVGARRTGYRELLVVGNTRFPN